MDTPNEYSKRAVVARRAEAPPVVLEGGALPQWRDEVKREVSRSATGRKLPNEEIEQRLIDRLERVNDYLAGDNLTDKLKRAGLSQVGVYEGILLTHLANLRGKQPPATPPTESAKFNVVMPLLLAELKKRGLTATLTETTRTAEVTAE